MTFARITVRAEQMGGDPCIRGLRIPVATVVGMVADGMTTNEIVAAYPDLEAANVEEALRYAAEACRNVNSRSPPVEVPPRQRPLATPRRAARQPGTTSNRPSPLFGGGSAPNDREVSTKAGRAHTTAMGRIIEPVAPRIFSGSATNANS
jgi:uncharacterized protein (DUF433 family)